MKVDVPFILEDNKKKYIYKDQCLTAAEWAEKLDISEGTFIFRLYKKSCIDDIFKTRKEAHSGWSKKDHSNELLPNGVKVNSLASYDPISCVALYNITCMCGKEFVARYYYAQHMTHCLCRIRERKEELKKLHSEYSTDNIIETITEFSNANPKLKRSELRKIFNCSDRVLGQIDIFNFQGCNDIDFDLLSSTFRLSPMEDIIRKYVLNEIAEIDDILVVMEKNFRNTFWKTMVDNREWENWVWLNDEDKKRFEHYFGPIEIEPECPECLKFLLEKD